MKAIILAAGIGSRLDSDLPKVLSKVINEKTILDFQIEKISKKFGINNILVVIGYKKEHILEKFPTLNFVFNDKYQTTNTAKSLLLALQKINDDIICVAGDLYFDEAVLDLISNTKHSAALVDKKICESEDIKYNLDSRGYIRNLSKSVKNPTGKALGIFLIKKDDLKEIKKELNHLNDNDYFSKGLENLIGKGKLKVVPVYVGNLFCKEFDFKDELKNIIKFVNTQLEHE